MPFICIPIVYCWGSSLNQLLIILRASRAGWGTGGSQLSTFRLTKKTRLESSSFYCEQNITEYIEDAVNGILSRATS